MNWIINILRGLGESVTAVQPKHGESGIEVEFQSETPTPRVVTIPRGKTALELKDESNPDAWIVSNDVREVEQ